MEDHLQPLFFDEVQRFPLWIRAIVLLVVVALGCPAILMWSFMEADLGLVRMLFAALTLVALVGAALTFRTELVTKSAFQNRLAGRWHRNGASPLAYRDAKLADRGPRPAGRPTGFETCSKSASRWACRERLRPIGGGGYSYPHFSRVIGFSETCRQAVRRASPVGE
jgi:hypothetical protein